jgi:single-strand DNA-binding protein
MLNKVLLIGRTGDVPTVKTLDGGVKVATLRIATNEYFKDNKQHTEWHTVVAWRGLADVAEKYIKKGSLIYVEGKIRRKKFNDKDGNERYSFEIQADVIRLLGKSTEPEVQEKVEEPSADDFLAKEEETPEFDKINEDDDDLPF